MKKPMTVDEFTNFISTELSIRNCQYSNTLISINNRLTDTDTNPHFIMLYLQSYYFLKGKLSVLNKADSMLKDPKFTLKSIRKKASDGMSNSLSETLPSPKDSMDIFLHNQYQTGILKTWTDIYTKLV